MRRLAQPLAAALVGLTLGLGITWLAGENPLHVLSVLVRGAFGSRYDLGMTLFYATPLIFTGLSVAVAFEAGLFNVGAEGQLTVGALAAACVGATWRSLPPVVAPLMAAVAGMLAGAAWGAIPGWLRAKRQSHEVINTIMLNFIASALASYVVLHWLRNPASQNPETRDMGNTFLLSQFSFFDGAPVSAALPIAFLTAAACYLLLTRTRFGYELRIVARNENAARLAGIDPARVRLIVFVISGALAGMVAVGEVLGNAGRFKLGFSPDYGFMGIAVALLGRNHPGGVVAAALFFGALHKGTADLDLETEHVTRELSLVLQGLILLCVSADGLWYWFRKKPPAAEMVATPQTSNP